MLKKKNKNSKSSKKNGKHKTEGVKTNKPNVMSGLSTELLKNAKCSNHFFDIPHKST